MKKSTYLKGIVFLLALCVCLPAASVYADASNAVLGETAENRPVATVPATGTSEAEANSFSPQMLPPSADFRQTVVLSPASVSGELPKVRQELTEQEVGILVDKVMFWIADTELGVKVIKTQHYIANKDYSGFLKYQYENPEILEGLIRALEKTSAASTGDPATKAFADEWLSEAKEAQAILQSQGDGSSPKNDGLSDPLIDRMVTLYQPIVSRISEITQNLESMAASWKDSETRTSMGDLLKDFSDEAKEFILNSLSRAQANLENGILSGPLEATAFAAENPGVLVPSGGFDPTAVRERTLAELYIDWQGNKYQVTNSVYLGKDFFYTHKMLHPPANLHPYLKWLLYIRNLTPRMVENYLTARKAVLAIYEQAKEGQGKIRYRGKVYGAFLPFAETAAGNYELVKAASVE